MYKLYVLVHDAISGDVKKQIIDFEATEDDNRLRLEIKVNTVSTKFVCFNLIHKSMLDVLDVVEAQFEDPETKNSFYRRTSAFFNKISLSNGTLPSSRIGQDGRREYIQSEKYSSKDDFNNITCLGGHSVITVWDNNNKHRIHRPRADYIHESGEFIVSWSVEEQATLSPIEASIDFFVITAIIDGREIPIGSYPFKGFSEKPGQVFDYKYRTQSFIGVAGNVSFCIWPVYNDFKIDYGPYLTSTQRVLDINDFSDSVKIEGI